MANKELLQYVKKELNKGFPKRKIKEVLLNAGYKEEHIEQAFKELAPKRAPPTRLFFIILILIIILIVTVTILNFSPLRKDLKSLQELSLYKEVPISSMEFRENTLNKDVKTCTEAGKSSETCYNEVYFSYMYNDPYNKIKYNGFYCGLIQNDEQKEECYLIVYTEAAKRTNEQAYCSLIKNKEKINLCKDLFWLDEAKLSGDLNKCNFIKESTIKQRCLDQINYNIATFEKNEAKCYEIQNKSKQEGCLDYVYTAQAIKQASIEPCKKVKYTEMRDYCYFDLGANHQISSYCQNIENQDIKTACIAISTENVDMCKGVGSKTYNYLCYIFLAEYTSDKYVCENLEEQELKDKCYEYYTNL